MLKANKKTLIITSIITILPIFVGLFFWNRLPDVMATHFGIDNTYNFPCSLCILKLHKNSFNPIFEPAKHVHGNRTLPVCHVSGQTEQIQQGQGQLHRKGNSFIKPMQLRNVLLTHDSCKRAVIPQSRIQPTLPVDVCADSIFKLASALCLKQDSLC